jgi:hypothetical protein
MEPGFLLLNTRWACAKETGQVVRAWVPPPQPIVPTPLEEGLQLGVVLRHTGRAKVQLEQPGSVLGAEGGLDKANGM